MPKDNRKLWNFSSVDSGKFSSSDYPERFKNAYALLKAFEAAGYLKL